MEKNNTANPQDVILEELKKSIELAKKHAEESKVFAEKAAKNTESTEDEMER